MKQNISSLLTQVEECLISKQLPEAIHILESIKPSMIPREEFLRASQLYRHVGWYEQALRLLHGLVYKSAKASVQEVIEYALCLQRCGAIREACQLLEGLPPKEMPEVLLYKTIFKFSEWDFRGGVKNLLQLINTCDPESYLHRLAQLNLASAFVLEEKYEEAETVLTELRQATAERGEYLMFCNTLEVSIQVAVSTENYELAQELLEQAKSVMKSASAVETLWFVKWQAMTKAFISKDTSHLQKARDLAIEKHHWEMVRDIDFAKCKISFDQNLYNKLYFGTPYPSYRRRLEQEFGSLNNKKAFIHANGVYRNVMSAHFYSLTDLKGDLKASEVSHTLLSVLLSDAYRRWSLAPLFSYVFCNEPFHPDIAQEKINKVVAKLNASLSKQVPGAKVVCEQGLYEIDLSGLEKPIEIPQEFAHLKVKAVERKKKKRKVS